VHKNARLTPRGREWLVELIASGQTPKAVSEALAICPRTVRKWFERYRREGGGGIARSLLPTGSAAHRWLPGTVQRYTLSASGFSSKHSKIASQNDFR
jgi:transposase-like protein